MDNWSDTKTLQLRLCSSRLGDITELFAGVSPAPSRLLLYLIIHIYIFIYNHFTDTHSPPQPLKGNFLELSGR